MRYFVILLSLLCSLFLTATEKPIPLVKKLLARCVSVESSEGHGSGIIVAQGFVLTNFHVLHSGSDIKVNGKRADIVKVDLKNDLTLLSTETIFVAPLELAKEINLDDEVVCVGNPLAHKGMVSRGRIVAIDSNGTAFTDAHLFFGSSGGGVYSVSGELIGIVRGIEGKAGDGFPYGIIVPSSVIRTFLHTKRATDIKLYTEDIPSLNSVI